LISHHPLNRFRRRTESLKNLKKFRLSDANNPHWHDPCFIHEYTNAEKRKEGFMKNFKNMSLVFGLMILSACGSQSSRDQLQVTTTANNTTGNNWNNGSGNVNNLPAAQQDVVQLSGLNGGASSQTYNFSTSQILRVKVEALAAPHLTINGYSNWVFPYGCMRVNVTVNGSTKMTKILRVDGLDDSKCKGAPTSEILDFSGIMTGSGPVTVTFSNAQYDNCRYYNPLAYGCDMTAVWQNHQVSLNATVQTDGTWME